MLKGFKGGKGITGKDKGRGDTHESKEECSVRGSVGTFL